MLRAGSRCVNLLTILIDCMCGRYVRRSDKQRIAEYFRTGETVFDLPPDYNVAPTTFQPVIRLSQSTGDRKLVMMRWGLVPSWHKDPKHLGVSAINAQAETLEEKPMWRQSVAETPMPGACGCVLRVAETRCQEQAAVCIRHEEWGTVRICRTVGAMDGSGREAAR